MSGDHLEFEAKFWGDCCNTFDEEQKHYVYAKYMGLDLFKDAHGYGFEVAPVEILDVGGGPVSILLKTKGFTHATVVDPIRYPAWVYQRYLAHKVNLDTMEGEQFLGSGRYGEVWLYNVLQHTEDPNLVLKNIWNALRPGGFFRFFEWIGIPPYEGHPHEINSQMFAPLLLKSSRSNVRIVELAESGCFGKAFCGWLQKPASADSSSENSEPSPGL